MWENVWLTILQGDFLMALFMAILALLITIVNIVLYPISLLISTFIPDLNQGLLAISDYFQMASTYLAWGINLVAIPSAVFIVVIAYYSMVLVLNIIVWVGKLALIWVRHMSLK